MRLKLTVAALLITMAMAAQQKIDLPQARFCTGDDMEYAEVSCDDSRWSLISTYYGWEQQGYEYNGFAWYRIHFKLPAEIRDNSYYKDWLYFNMAKIDDADETYLNGTLIGKTGSFPQDEGGYVSAFSKEREYRVSMDNPILKWGEENVIAVRVYDQDGIGGIGAGIPYVHIKDLIDMLEVKTEFIRGRNESECVITMHNSAKENQKGQYTISTVDTNTGEQLNSLSGRLNLNTGKTHTRRISYPEGERIQIKVTYTDSRTDKISDTKAITPYILTPAASAEPRINSPKVFGVRPGSPILFKVAASGQKPIKYSAANLPPTVEIDPETGILSGNVSQAGDYEVEFEASNSYGSARQKFTLKVGDKLSLTPPMGWNSWNCWGLSVSQAKVESSARALIEKGLIDYGWSYINIDDAWQNNVREEDGTLKPNMRFPDIRHLGEWLHSVGLKMGIYSSPGPLTCGKYLGAWEHEAIDAATYADWGVDYLKYDWCGYDRIYAQKNEHSISSYMFPYVMMDRELRKQNRDIVYSICQYGMWDVWDWGEAAGGNCWRTTGDILDTWDSMRNIAISQRPLAGFAKPGHWNDPDMLIVGKVGWGPNLHSTRLTVDEQYLHISLWSMLSAPLLIGCDIAQMDDFTLGLLTNPEVIEINQDPLGKQAVVVKQIDMADIWVKEMEDGSKAVCVTNWGEYDMPVEINPSQLGLDGLAKIRDVWRRCDVDSENGKLIINVPKHGVALYRYY